MRSVKRTAVNPPFTLSRAPRVTRVTRTAGAAGRRGRWASPVPWAYAACLAPVVILAARIAGSGWAPQGDAAVIGLKTLAILDGNPPLLGQWSTGAAVSGHAPPHHPGPIYYYLLAPVAALTGGSGWGLLLAAAAVLAGCLALAVHAARWVAGDGVALAVGVVLGAPAVVLAGAPLTPWNSYPGAFALPAAALLTAALLRHRWRALPWWIVAIAVAAQSQAGTAIPAAALCVPAGWALARGLQQGRGDAERGSSPATRAVAPLPRRILLFSGLLAVLCWLPVLLELVRDTPNNIELLLSYAGADGVERFGLVSAITWTTAVLGPGPLDLLGLLAAGGRYLEWLDSADSSPALRLLLAAARPAGLAIVVAAVLVGRYLRRPEAHTTGHGHERAGLLIPALLAALASIWALGRADVSGGDSAMRGLYGLLCAPTILVLVVLTLWAAGPGFRRRWPALADRWARRPRFLQGRPVALAVAALLALVAAVQPPRLDTGIHADLLSGVVRDAVRGQSSVELVANGPGSGLALSAVAYAARSAGSHYVLTSGDFLDADFTAYRPEKEPRPTIRIAIVGTNDGQTPQPPPGNWDTIGSAPRDAIFTNPAGQTTIYRSR